MPTGTVESAVSPKLLGGKDSLDPTRRSETTVADVAVRDGLLIIGGAFVLLMALIFSVRSHIV